MAFPTPGFQPGELLKGTHHVAAPLFLARPLQLWTQSFDLGTYSRQLQVELTAEPSAVVGVASFPPPPLPP